MALEAVSTVLSVLSSLHDLAVSLTSAELAARSSLWFDVEPTELVYKLSFQLHMFRAQLKRDCARLDIFVVIQQQLPRAVPPANNLLQQLAEVGAPMPPEINLTKNATNLKHFSDLSLINFSKMLHHLDVSLKQFIVPSIRSWKTLVRRVFQQVIEPALALGFTPACHYQTSESFSYNKAALSQVSAHDNWTFAFCRNVTGAKDELAALAKTNVIIAEAEILRCNVDIFQAMEACKTSGESADAKQSRSAARRKLVKAVDRWQKASLRKENLERAETIAIAEMEKNALSYEVWIKTLEAEAQAAVVPAVKDASSSDDEGELLRTQAEVQTKLRHKELKVREAQTRHPQSWRLRTLFDRVSIHRSKKTLTKVTGKIADLAK